VSVIIEATCHVLSSDKHHIIEQFTHGSCHATSVTKI